MKYDPALRSSEANITLFFVSLHKNPIVYFRQFYDLVKDPAKAYEYTNKGNLVAVISNGTAVLGLGNIGALASKPVMEGKAVLFKKFAKVNAIDIEVDTADPEELIRTVKLLEPSFGGVNLEGREHTCLFT